MNEQFDFEQVGSLEELLGLLKSKGVPGKEYHRIISAYHSHKARLNKIPVSGQFELTPLCNLNCKMCYVHMSPEQIAASGMKMLTTAQWKDIFQQAYECGMRYACLTGGECLTHPGFRELYLFLYDLGVRVSLKTNGVLLEEYLDFFKKYPPSNITITLYGSCEEAYEQVCGVRAFEKVMGAIRALKETDIPLMLALTPSEYMGEDLFRCINLMHELDAPTIINTFLLPARADTERTVTELSAKDYAEIVKYNYLLNGGKLAEPDCFAPPVHESGGVSEAKYGIRCGAGRSGFNVTWDGGLYACANLPEISADLMQSDFQTGWAKISKQVEEIPLPVECEDCSYRDLCISCIAVHHLAKNPGHCNPGLCALTEAMIEAGIRKQKTNN